MSKTIMITDDVYRALSGLKHSNESFTDLLARLSGMTKNKKSSLLECAGLWADMSEKEVKQIKQSIQTSRKNWRKLKWYF